MAILDLCHYYVKGLYIVGIEVGHNTFSNYSYKIGINIKQAGAELGQAQFKLELDFNSNNFNKTSLIQIN